MTNALFTWFRRAVLRRVTVTGAGAHGVYVGDLIEISRSMRGVYDGDHVVTRIVSPVAFEARRCRPWLSGTAAYIGAMALSFLSGMFQLTVAAELAADAGESVLTWLAVAVIGLILFFQAITMALVSVQAERAEQLLEEAER